MTTINQTLTAGTAQARFSLPKPPGAAMFEQLASNLFGGGQTKDDPVSSQQQPTGSQPQSGGQSENGTPWHHHCCCSCPQIELPPLPEPAPQPEPEPVPTQPEDCAGPMDPETPPIPAATPPVLGTTPPIAGGPQPGAEPGGGYPSNQPGSGTDLPAVSDEQALDTIVNNFGTFDVAADGGEPDGQISQADLQAVVDGNYPDDLKAAAQQLLSNGNLFAQLDVASEYGTRPDGVFGRDDIDMLQQGPIDQHTALSTVQANFDTFAAAHSEPGANPYIIGTNPELTREDLQAVLDGDYPPDMKAAAKYLLNDTALWSELDAAGAPAGLTNPTDGIVHRDTINAYLTPDLGDIVNWNGIW